MVHFVYDFWHTKCCNSPFGRPNQACITLRKRVRLALFYQREELENNEREKLRPAR